MEALVVSIVAVGSFVLATALMFASFAPTRVWVAASGSTSILQVYTVSIGGVFPSLSLITSFGAMRSLNGLPLLIRQPWFAAAAAMTLAQSISLTWSPDKIAGLRALVYSLPFFLLVAGTVEIGRRDPRLVHRILKFSLVPMALHAVFVILFRVSPELEGAFLSSQWARVVISPNTLDGAFGAALFNVSDSTKSGGLMVNANSAAALLGFGAIASWYVGRLMCSGSLRAISLLCWIAVWFTGSKAGVLAACAVPSMLAVVELARNRRASVRSIFAVLALLFVGAIVLGIAFDVGSASRFHDDAGRTMQSRLLLWDLAERWLRERPLTGLGFGGWEERVPRIGRYELLPAHNAFLILWLQSGIVAVALALLFAVALIGWALRLSLTRPGNDALLPMALLGSATWLFAQAQGENFGLIGEAHFTPMLAILAGAVLAEDLTARERATRPDVER